MKQYKASLIILVIKKKINKGCFMYIIHMIAIWNYASLIYLFLEIPTGRLELPENLTPCMSLDCGWKLKYPDRSPRKGHSKRLQTGFKPRTFSLCGGRTNQTKTKQTNKKPQKTLCFSKICCIFFFFLVASIIFNKMCKACDFLVTFFDGYDIRQADLFPFSVYN